MEIRALLIACWSVKGGAGTTVVAATLSLLLARREPAGALLADLTGDVPGTIGLPEPRTAGLSEWLRAGTDVPSDALIRMEVDAAPGLSLLPRGTGPLDPARGNALGALLDRSRRPAVVDCGNLTRDRACPTAAEVAHLATRSLLVIRPCYLSIRHATEDAVVRPTGAVVIGGGRVLGRHDVERAVGVPAVAHIHEDPAISRAVDSGLLTARLPRALTKGLGNAL